MLKKIPKIVVLLLLMPALCQATAIDFYTDGTIEDGEVYDVVTVWDDATVDMTGGLIENSLVLWETSTVNIYGGALGEQLGAYAHIDLCDFSTLHLHDLEVTEDHRIWTEPDNPKVHIYGYGFEYVQSSSDWLLYGYWVDGSPFSVRLRGPMTRPNTVLHVTPEPATMLFLGLGGIFLRGRKK